MNKMNQLPTPPPSEPVQKAQAGIHDDVKENKDIAALSYVWVLSVFVYTFRHSSPFVRFHAKQGMVLFALSVACWFVPIIGKLLVLIVLAGMAIGLFSAAQGQWREIPFVYPLSSGDAAALRRSWKDLLHMISQLWKHVRHPMKATDIAEKPAEGAQSNSTNPTSSNTTV